MAALKWGRIYVSYQASENKLCYLNSHVQTVCKLIRYVVMWNLEPLLNEPPQHRKSYVQCTFTKCMELRAVIPSAPGWQSWKSLQGLS